MNKFEYARPETVAEAVGLLEEYGPDARILAGGTDLVIELRNRWTEPKVVIDVKRIPEFAPSITERGGVVSISAGTVMADLTASESHSAALPGPCRGSGRGGVGADRARATLAGNICNGSPAADTAPPLLVYDATIVIAGPSGRAADLPIDEFIVGPGQDGAWSVVSWCLPLRFRCPTAHLALLIPG